MLRTCKTGQVHGWLKVTRLIRHSYSGNSLIFPPEDRTWIRTAVPRSENSSCPQVRPSLLLGPLCAYLCEEKATRDKAVKHLVQFLSAGGALSDDLELAKLWKGIFYCTPPLYRPTRY